MKQNKAEPNGFLFSFLQPTSGSKLNSKTLPGLKKRVGGRWFALNEKEMRGESNQAYIPAGSTEEEESIAPRALPILTYRA